MKIRWADPQCSQVGRDNDDWQASLTAVTNVTTARRSTRSLWLVIAGAMALYLCGIDWGIPNVTAWHPDDIVNETLRTMADGFRGYPKYALVHYLVLALVYAPILGFLYLTSGLTLGAPTLAQAFGHAVGLMTVLILVGRAVTAIMGAATVWLIHRIALRLTSCNAAAVGAAAVYAVSSEIVFFSHLTNVDVPMMFWFAASLLALFRFSESFRVVDGLQLGLLSALAVCTKEQIAGAYILPAGLLFALMLRRRRFETGRGAVRGFAVAGVTAAVAFAVLNKLPFQFDAYRARLRFWFSLGIDPATRGIPYDTSLVGRLEMLGATLVRMAQSVGTPALIVLLAFAAFSVKWRDLRFWLLVTPLASYYVFTLSVLRYLYTRFTFPLILLLCLLAALGASRVLAMDRRWLRGFAAVAAAVAISWGAVRSIRLDLAFAGDPRYAAEGWLLRNTSKKTSVEIYDLESYLPRFTALGIPYARVGNEAMEARAFEARLPDVVVLAPSCWYRYTARERNYVKWLRARRDYQEIRFEPGPESEWLPYETRIRLQPAIILLARRAAP